MVNTFLQILIVPIPVVKTSQILSLYLKDDTNNIIYDESNAYGTDKQIKGIYSTANRHLRIFSEGYRRYLALGLTLLVRQCVCAYLFFGNVSLSLVVIVISVLAGVNKITTHLGFIGWCEKSFSCETHESDVEFENSK